MIADKYAGEPTYLYVTGRGHSGTTLLGMLLGNHPDVCSVGELMYMSLQCHRDESARWPGLCGCGKRPFDCEFWGPVIASVERKYATNLRQSPFAWRISDAGIEAEYRSRAAVKSPVSWLRHKVWRATRKARYARSPALRTLGGIYAPQKCWIENRSYLAARIAEQSGCSTIADISKDYLDMRDVYDYAALPTKVVFITRDCRANVWSQVRLHCERHGDDAREDIDNVIAGSARDWVKVNRKILDALASVPQSDWVHVRYEDICRDTANAVTPVLALAGLEYSEQVLDFAQSVQHTIAGNHIRFDGETKGIREDVAWQQNLRDNELAIVAEICRPLAARLGYAL